MPHADANLPGLTQYEAAIRAFETAWRQGQRPFIDQFLPQEASLRSSILLELVHIELELRLKAGEPVRVESYFERYPELVSNRSAAVALLGAEYRVRRRSDPALTAEEYRTRFPQFAGELAALEADEVCHADSKRPAERLPPTSFPTLPGYEMLERLGMGAMGMVYKAKHLALNRLVAVKMVRTAVDAEAKERFAAEGRAVARLRHPNIVQVFDAGVHDGQPYYAMELMEGGTLAGMLSGTPLPPRRAAELTAALAWAIQSAHQAGVIHRDLKPANVLLSVPPSASGHRPKETDALRPAADGRKLAAEPKIADFGLAKLLDDDSAQTRTGQILGTPSYMAPEQTEGGRGAATPAVDVYALGAVLYEMLTGRPPFKGTDVLSTLEQVRRQEPVAPRQLNTSTPRDLETICLKCLSKEPARRYGSAAELGDDLDRFLAGRPIHARPIGPAERLGRWCRREPARAAAVFAIALLLLLSAAGSILWAVQLRNRNIIIDNRNTELQRISTHLAQTLKLEEKLRHQLMREQEEKEAADYRHLVRAAYLELEKGTKHHAWEFLQRCPLKHRRFEWHYAARLCAPAHRRLEHGDVVFGVAISKDGKRVASACADGRVWLWDLESGNELGRWKGHDGFVLAVDFSPDGRHVVSGGRDGTVRVWETDSGRLVWTSSKSRAIPGGDDRARAVHRVLWHPDGKRIFSSGGEGHAAAWNAQTGEKLRDLEGHKGDVNALALSPDGKVLATGDRHKNPEAASRLPIESWNRDYGTICVWNAETYEKIFTFGDDTDDGINDLAFNPEATVLMSLDRRGQLKRWTPDSKAGKPLEELSDKSKFFSRLATSRDGSRWAFGNHYDYTIGFTDIGHPENSETLAGHKDAISCLTFSDDGRILASASADGSVLLHQLPQGKRENDPTVVGQPATLVAPNPPVLTIAFTPAESLVVSGGMGRHVQAWDLAGNRQAFTYHDFDSLAATTAAFTPDGGWLVLGFDSGKLLVFNAAAARWAGWAMTGSSDKRANPKKPEGQFELPGHAKWVTALAFDVTGKRMASADETGLIRLWDTGSWKPVAELKGHADRVNSLAFDPRTGRLASASHDGTVRIWDVNGAKELAKLEEHRQRVLSVAYSKDGWLASSDAEGQIVLRPPEASRPPLRLGHRLGPTTRLAFSPDGDRLAAASGEPVRSITLYEVSTGLEMAVLKGHTAPIYSLAFSPDGHYLASGAANAVLKLWDARPLSGE